MAKAKKWYKNDRLIQAVRDAVMFVVGVAGVVYETVTPADARPILVGVFVAMLGLPFALALDRTATKKDDDDD